jgi:hypothetical protein
VHPEELLVPLPQPAHGHQVPRGHNVKPGIIVGEFLTEAQDNAVWEWLKANGCRHHVPRDAKLTITGNMVIVPTFDIGRIDAPRYYWGDSWMTDRLPIKTRRYRIRHPLVLPRP